MLNVPAPQYRVQRSGLEFICRELITRIRIQIRPLGLAANGHHMFLKILLMLVQVKFS